MATILFTPSSSRYSCPQKTELTEDSVQPTVRRLSEQSERRRSEARRLSESYEEKATMTRRLSVMQEGKLPSNQQINTCISKFLNSRVIASQNMSEDGKIALRDIKGLLVAIQRALFLRNSGELFQSMVYHMKTANAMQTLESDESKLKTLDVLKTVKFLLFDNKFKSLLNKILVTAQNILDPDFKKPLPKAGSSTADTDPKSDISYEDTLLCIKDIFTTLRKNPAYRPSLEALLNLIILWTDSLLWTRDLGSHSKEESLAASKAKEILRRWTENTQLDPFLKKLNDIACSVRNNSDLSEIFLRARELSERSLREDVFDKDGWNNWIRDAKKSSEIVKRRKTMLDLTNEGQRIIGSFKNDSISKEISEKLYSLYRYLWKDKTILKPQVINDIKMTLFPALIEQISYIPLPQLTVQNNEKYEVTISNMAFPGDTLMPKAIEVKVDDYLKFCPDSNTKSINIQSLFVQLQGIQTTMDDVSFCYKRRAGFMGFQDSGIASVKINDLNLSVRLVSDSKDRVHRFQVEHCLCTINKLSVHVKESKHR
ncbi:hypothetical protein BY458DRAFT_532891 [Sporodiniella umbellata]|nr:hypothetical protein BY458DRAFT_532891 [Sporodiniella umbellata]